jgi:hypothetical protein
MARCRAMTRQSHGHRARWHSVRRRGRGDGNRVRHHATTGRIAHHNVADDQFLPTGVGARLRFAAHVVNRSKNTGYVECDVTDPEGKLIAKAMSTCTVLRGDQAKAADRLLLRGLYLSQELPGVPRMVSQLGDSCRRPARAMVDVAISNTSERQRSVSENRDIRAMVTGST